LGLGTSPAHLYFKHCCSGSRFGVARWHIFKKSQLTLILEGLSMEDVGKFYGHFVYFTAIWHVLYILKSFGIYLPFLVCCTKTNLATQTRIFRFIDVRKIRKKIVPWRRGAVVIESS
jgi:hypothetical protein